MLVMLINQVCFRIGDGGDDDAVDAVDAGYVGLPGAEK